MTRLDRENVLRLERELDRSQVIAIYEQMGRALREIHRIAMEAFGYLGPAGLVTLFADNRAYMLSQSGAAAIRSTAARGPACATTTSTPATCWRWETV